jgi:hypothetical protein
MELERPVLSREEDLTKGILSTHLHSEESSKDPRMEVGTDILRSLMMKVIFLVNGQFVFKMQWFVLLK